jgi:peptidyl-prolyl cis-trans isomerase C
MKFLHISLLSLLTMSLAACHPGSSASGTATTSGPSGADTVATVNGKVISRDLFDVYLKEAMRAQGKDPAVLTQQQKEELLDNLVKFELVVQQGEKKDLPKDPQTAQLIELSRMNALQEAFTEDFVKENKPTDAELQKEYDAQVAQLQHTEYHVEHILVPDPDAATAIIARLNKGAKFEDEAKKNSTDPSKNQGGELGWMTPDHAPAKPFGDALPSLKVGEYTHVPVKTDYGWHIIKVVETRPLAPPSFERAKEQLTQIVLGKKYKAYVDDLVAKAQIDKKI